MSHTSALAFARASDEIREHLSDILAQRRLTALFQPIVDMGRGTILGYEGLIRGPSDSPLHSPIQLFNAATAYGLSVQVEHLCRRVVIEEFVRLGMEAQLFLNVSPEALVQRDSRRGETLHLLKELGLASDRVVIELTESQPSYDYELMRQAIAHYRSMGFRIAIDDLGEGFSSLRRWSELRPEFVKVDMHFIQGIDRDPLKRQFVHAIRDMARGAGTQVIAEGIESEGELLALRRIGLQLGQGYVFDRPSRLPITELPAGLAATLTLGGRATALPLHAASVGTLARPTPYVDPGTRFDAVCQLFTDRPDIPALPVVDCGVPLGLILRNHALMRMAEPFGRELHGRKPCGVFMDRGALVVDAGVAIQDLGQRVAAADPKHLLDGFIVIEDGQFMGYGTGHDLMRAIAAMQIESARLANPLTGLPGNLPINERMNQWLSDDRPFVAGYCDLDHFKPFNDLFGYASGDEVIVTVARLLKHAVDPGCDFLGHVGGDDFIVLFRSPDWRARCEALLGAFAEIIPRLFGAEEVARGHYEAEDREGRRVQVPLLSLSIGCVEAARGRYPSHVALAGAAAVAKRQAKKRPGNSLFVAESSGTE